MTALPDENQEKTIPAYQVGSTGPNQIGSGAYHPAIKDKDDGTIEFGEQDDNYAVPGTPHYSS